MNLDATQLFILAMLGVDHLAILYLALFGNQRAAQTFPITPIPTPPVPVPVSDPVPSIPISDPPKPPTPAPISKPIPVPVPPVPAPVVGTPRFTVTATDFAGPKDSISSSTSAYDGHIIRGATELAAALPYHFPGTPPTIRVFANSKTVDVPIEDVGPYNTHDVYWDGSGHPLAESQYANQTRAQDGRIPSQPSGLDLTPAVYKALGFSGDLNNITTHLSWDFVSVLDKGTSPAPVSPITPPTPSPVISVSIPGIQHVDYPAQSQALSYYGAPGTNLVKVTCPWQLTVEGTKTNTITINAKCAASLTQILNAIWNHPDIGQSQEKINEFCYNVFDGSFNDRDIANTNTPSQHAYGAALDFNAALNPQKAPLKKKDGSPNTKFQEDSLIVVAFKQAGWTWGGDWSPEYIDAMHFQMLKA